MRAEPYQFPLRRHRDWLANERPPSMSFGDGWAAVVDDMLDAIAIELRARPGTRIYVDDLKEKYGTLQTHWFGEVPDEVSGIIDRIVQTAEVRSAGTCDVCGRRGRMRESRSAWLAARCDRHGDGFERLVGKDPPEWRTSDRRGAFLVRYDHDRGVLIETPVL